MMNILGREPSDRPLSTEPEGGRDQRRIDRKKSRSGTQHRQVGEIWHDDSDARWPWWLQSSPTMRGSFATRQEAELFRKKYCKA